MAVFAGIEIVELTGYTASAVVLFSFLRKKIVQLRIINAAGCALFVVYGFCLDPVSWPIVITNAAILLIHGYYLLIAKKAENT